MGVGGDNPHSNITRQMNFKIQFDIDDKVTDRFWRNGIVSWYFIWRSGLMYEIEDQNGTWYEYPNYVKKVEIIWFSDT